MQEVTSTNPHWLPTAIIALVTFLLGLGFALYLRLSDASLISKSDKIKSDEAAHITEKSVATNTVSIDGLKAQNQEQSIELAKLKLQIEMFSPFWKAVQEQTAKDLHHPEPEFAEMDALIERLLKLTITSNERTKLKGLLVERVSDPHDSIKISERASAQLLIFVMDKVVVEAADIKLAGGLRKLSGAERG